MWVFVMRVTPCATGHQQNSSSVHALFTEQMIWAGLPVTSTLDKVQHFAWQHQGTNSHAESTPQYHTHIHQVFHFTNGFIGTLGVSKKLYVRATRRVVGGLLGLETQCVPY